MSDQPMSVVVTFAAEDLEWSAVDLSDWDAEYLAGAELERQYRNRGRADARLIPATTSAC